MRDRGPIRSSDPVNRDHFLNRGKILWWIALPHLMRGKTFVDLMGKYPGTIVNTTADDRRMSSRPGGWGQLTLDGADGRISNGTVGDFTASPFSICAWVYKSVDHGVTADVLFYKGSFNINGYYFQDHSSGMAFLTNQSGANQQSTAPAGLLPISTWHHVAVTRSGASARIFVDGTDRTTTAATHVNPVSSSDNFVVGGYSSAGTANNFNGNFDDVQVFDRALTATEVRAIYEVSQVGYPDMIRRIRSPRIDVISVFKPAWASKGNPLIGSGVS